MRTSIAISALLSVAPLTSAWGVVGHQAVAFVAQDLISPQTKAWAQAIIGDKTSSFLANYATWADSYKSTSVGAFTKPFHYIDANDSPPQTCNVDYNRDCPQNNCVVSAIANYTNLLQDTSQSQIIRNQSLMFLIHFIGDVHQPLHDEAISVGGNGIMLTYAGSRTNLHHIWDTNMPEQFAGTGMSSARSWATILTNQINNGSYKSLAPGWIKGISVTAAQTSALSWASDSNAFVCSTVFSESQAQIQADTDLAGKYYNTALPIIQVQIAKAGYRLAAWMNLLATGTPRLNGRESESDAYADWEEMDAVAEYEAIAMMARDEDSRLEAAAIEE